MIYLFIHCVGSSSFLLTGMGIYCEIFQMLCLYVVSNQTEVLSHWASSNEHVLD